MESIVQQFFNLAIMERALPLVLAGLEQTIVICLIVIPLGLAGGLAFAIVSLSRLRTVRWAAMAGIDFFRAIPPLVLLIFIYAGLPFAGLRPSPMTAVAVAFFLNTSSYYGEIYRAGIESVGQGQWDAARSTGLQGYQTLAYVVLPQALRLTVPPITNRTIAITKNTALGTVIGVGEILNQATTAQSFSGNATPLMMGAVAYVILFIPVVVLGRLLETRFRWRRA